jgi:hypothetical protein
VCDGRRAVAPQHNRPTPSAPPHKLARKAGTIHNREILGCWLREVAYRTAIRARQRRARSTPQMEIQEVEESPSRPQTAASRNAEPARLGPGRGPILMGMIRPTEMPRFSKEQSLV